MELDGSFGLGVRLGVCENGYGRKLWVAWYSTWKELI